MEVFMNSQNRDDNLVKRDVQFHNTIDVFHLHLSKRIRETREAARYSRPALGRLVGVSKKTIERMEKHQMYTDPKTGVTTHTYVWVESFALIEVCRVLDIRMDDIWDAVMKDNSDI